MSTKKVDGVFEGGGVKGIGLAGALAVTEEQGYRFENVAGTSAGAIIAALVAAGYSAAELKAVIDNLDYREFKDESLIDHIPLLGPALSLGFEKGIYEGDYFEEWIREKLAAKGVHTFADLRTAETDARWRWRLKVIAADISRGKLLRFPDDAVDYKLDPDDLDVARAVRMSMSIPFFFEPVVLKSKEGRSCYIVDGGVLSNFPVWLFDSDGEPAWPTFGYKLVNPKENRPHQINGPLTLFAALFSTMLDAHDARYIEDQHFARTIPIHTGHVRSTDFDLSKADAAWLYAQGRLAAREFFDRWDFEAYKRQWRQGAPDSRALRL
ncbi:NTE family protein [Plasticicumulans lactativorans]|uniref:NTE family protein n=1 Tax=Plasticicumulans lactativorans TaxID=1133106 RepID=A0A4R2KYG3_9GAMM|nr:patatin-like phospholipase family protein [Plasticicumulans lactativorans]TCO79701.1 NTE family protein [Plasticicumulans lactativorans]